MRSTLINTSTIAPFPIPVIPSPIPAFTIGDDDPLLGKNYYALVLLAIPLFTVVGNGMVILAVIKNQHLHTAINYFIVGLAVADMLVAVAVMPFAVYVEVNRDIWELGKTLCDVYCATDVSCSTASILLLTVISFDRYRAVSHPISYSQSAKSVSRVWIIMAGVWAISLVTASPMVFGANHHNLTAPIHLLNNTHYVVKDADHCRFNNPMYSIFSSVISFGIPLVIVLFVYMRIVLELRKRAKAARARRATRKYKKATGKSMRVNKCNTIKTTPQVESVTHISISLANCRKTADRILMTGPPNVDVDDDLDLDDIDDDGSSVILDDGVPLNELLASEHGMDDTSPALNMSEVSSVDPASQHSHAISDCHDSKNGSAVRGSTLRTRTKSCLAKNCMLSPDDDSGGARRCSSTVSASPRAIDVKQTRIRAVTFSAARTVIRSISSRPLNKRSRPKFSTVSSLPPRSPNSEGAMVSRVMANMMMPSKFSLAKQFTGFKFPTSNNVKAKRERAQKKAAAKKERKATKTLVAPHILNIRLLRDRSRRRRILRQHRSLLTTLLIVLIVFLVCWVPFFWLNVQNAICNVFDLDVCKVDFLPFFLSTWLGYLNSTVNPIIYTVFNKEFRRAFRDVVFCKRSS